MLKIVNYDFNLLVCNSIKSVPLAEDIIPFHVKRKLKGERQANGIFDSVSVRDREKHIFQLDVTD